MKLILKYFFFTRSTVEHLNQIEIRTKKTLTLVFVCYFLFMTPLIMMHFIHIFGILFDDNLYLAAACIYLLQYSLNFVIYAARNEQYRQAYMLYLRWVTNIYNKFTYMVFDM